MTDEPMVERLTVALRELFTDGRVSTHYDGCWKYHKGCAALLAADTIDALLSQLREAQERADYWQQRAEEAEQVETGLVEVRDAYANSFATAERTIREQREALERIAGLGGRTGVQPIGVRIAREALAALAPDTEEEGT